MKKKFLVLALVSAMAVSLAACGSDNGASSDSASVSDVTSDAASDAASDEDSEEVVADAQTEDAATDGEAGFTEIPIFEDAEVGFLNLSAVYFQPVPMQNETQNISAEDFDLHLEADISALENKLGYGVGDWVPYLTVDYDVIGSDGNSAASGTFMTMAASDGPHYGANIKLPNADTYSVKITIHSPGENGYLIHSDSETGPGGLLEDYFGDGPLTYTFDGWDYTPQEW